jgi:hypothetical protein
MASDPLLVVAKLADVFNELGIDYVVGGSLASSVYGIPRATNDVDLLADVKRKHVHPLQKALETDFYVAEEAIVEAIRDRGSFNVIHLATMFKADIFIPRDDNLSNEEMVRARTETIQLGDTSRPIRFASPEDTILQKLIWYRLGGGISEQQWNDVKGVLKIQGMALDFGYLERSAAMLNIADLLQRARESAW